LTKVFLPLSLTMQVFVKSLGGNTLALDVTANSSVESVKAMIQSREGECKPNSALESHQNKGD
jgi:hypothetical protein